MTNEKQKLIIDPLVVNGTIPMANNFPSHKVIPMPVEVSNEQGGNSQSTIQNSYIEKFKGTILNQEKEYIPPTSVLNIIQNGEAIPLLTLKSFSLWQGKQKSKKTTILAILIAALIADCSQFVQGEGTFLQAVEKSIVLVFDTEQGESYAARTMRMILKLANLKTSPFLIYCDLREYPPSERMKIIAAGIECTPGVRMVIIDGLVDLLEDFMDAKDGHTGITEILRLCSKFNIHIAGVLHQNKSDKNARAHIGSIASQKCEMEISTEVDPDDRSQSIVSCVNSRGLPFEPFAIKWEKGSLPRINNEWNQAFVANRKESKNYERSRELAEAVFKPLAALSHSESMKAIMNAAKKSESTAKRLLKEFITWGFVVKGTDSLYRININSGVRVHEGSKEGS
jgi:hypothetical protein